MHKSAASGTTVLRSGSAAGVVQKLWRSGFCASAPKSSSPLSARLGAALGRLGARPSFTAPGVPVYSKISGVLRGLVTGPQNGLFGFTQRFDQALHFENLFRKVTIFAK